MTVLIILLSVWIIASVGFFLLFYKEIRTTDTMSIKESMDLVELPIITMINNGNKYNFIVDTGANDCLIGDKCEKIMCLPLKAKNEMIGINGNKKECHTVGIDLIYKDKTFSATFNVADIDSMIDTIKTDYGVTVHGILGTKFLDKYNYVIDFKDYTIYRRK